MRDLIKIIETNLSLDDTWQDAIDAGEWEEAFDRADTKEEIAKTLELCDAQKLVIGKETIYVTETHVIEWDGNTTYTNIEEKREWVFRARLDDFFPGYEDTFNDNFWKFPSALYHATPDENVESIEKNGLGPHDKTRGLSNRGVGLAVFTTSHYEYLQDGYYGDNIFVIDTKKMKAAGFTPYVSKEPPIVEDEYRQILARKIGLDEYYGDVESGIDENTVIIYDHIPPEYLELISE